MAGIANMVIGAGAAAATWAIPKYAPQLMEQLPELLVSRALDNDAGLIAGGAVAGLGVTQMMFGWIGQGMKALQRGPRTTDEKLVDQLFVRTTAAMAVADGHASEAEIEMVRAMALRFRGVTVAPARARAAIDAAEKSTRTLLKDLHKEAGAMPEHDKEQIVQGALWISMADLARDPGETKFLVEIAEALQLPPGRLEAMKQSLERAATSLVQAAATTPAIEPVMRPTS